MNIYLNLEFAIFLCVICLIVYACYVMIANNNATLWIDERRESIEEELKKFNTELGYKANYDCSPCEVQYGLAKLNEDPIYVISSRKMKRLLIKLSKHKISIEEAITYQERKGTLNNPPKPTFKL